MNTSDALNAHFILHASRILLTCSATVPSFSVRNFLRDFPCFTGDIYFPYKLLQEYKAMKK